jgi:hypothetical protein
MLLACRLQIAGLLFLYGLLVGAIPVRQGQQIAAELNERPAISPLLVNEVNSDENMTW